MFTRQDKTKLMQQVGDLKGELAALRAEMQAVSTADRLSNDIVKLRENIADLKAQESAITEKYERERREVEHMVGLERKRQAFEVDQAKREATVELREENLAADRKRFDEQMKFMESRLTEEVRYLKDDILKGILERLPTWNTEHIVTEERS